MPMRLPCERDARVGGGPGGAGQDATAGACAVRWGLSSLERCIGRTVYIYGARIQTRDLRLNPRARSKARKYIVTQAASSRACPGPALTNA